MAKREVNNPMLVAITLAVVLCIKAVECQEKPHDWPASYYVGPYKHIYPPTEISVDQKACRPEPDKNVTCPLFVELITSFGGSFVSSGIVPAIQVALDQINSRPDILPGYTLHYALLDSQVSIYCRKRILVAAEKVQKCKPQGGMKFLSVRDVRQSPFRIKAK